MTKSRKERTRLSALAAAASIYALAFASGAHPPASDRAARDGPLEVAEARGESPRAIASASARGDSDLRLVVLVVIDQLPAWTFERDRQHLEGGIARLLDEGTYAPEAEFPFATTLTAPGHAALSTGAPPAQSGIFANTWYRRGEGAVRSATADGASPVHAVGDRDPSGEGASPRHLEVAGIADAIRATDGEARAVSVGIKPRAAILAAGGSADLAVWYDTAQRAMTTSAYYAEEVPAWLAELHERSPITDRFPHPWEPTDPDLLAAMTGRPDDGPGEGQFPGYFGRTFPHAPGATLIPTRAFRLTPSAAEVTMETARAAVAAEELGGRGETDFLAITLGSHDYAGHYWGQESWERTDLLLRLDRMLGDFFAELDADLGPEGYAVVLTGDHGAAPLVEERAREGAARVPPREVEHAAQEAARAVLGPGEWIKERSASTIFFRGLEDRSERERASAIAAAASAIEDLEAIGFAAPTADLVGGCADRSGVEALACRALREELGEIYYAPARYSLITGYPTGTTHGSPHDYDRVVPLVIRAPGWESEIVRERVSLLRVAATLAELLGVAKPPQAPPALAPP